MNSVEWRWGWGDGASPQHWAQGARIGPLPLRVRTRTHTCTRAPARTCVPSSASHPAPSAARLTPPLLLSTTASWLRLSAQSVPGTGSSAATGDACGGQHAYGSRCGARNVATVPASVPARRVQCAGARACGRVGGTAAAGESASARTPRAWRAHTHARAANAACQQHHHHPTCPHHLLHAIKTHGGDLRAGGARARRRAHQPARAADAAWMVVVSSSTSCGPSCWAALAARTHRLPQRRGRQLIGVLPTIVASSPPAKLHRRRRLV